MLNDRFYRLQNFYLWAQYVYAGKIKMMDMAMIDFWKIQLNLVQKSFSIYQAENFIYFYPIPSFI